jgi:hypothetical protein
MAASLQAVFRSDCLKVTFAPVMATKSLYVNRSADGTSGHVAFNSYVKA